MAVINDLKVKFGGSELFGHEKDESFTVRSVRYTRLGMELTYTRQWRRKRLCCCILLSRIIHFSDGNKRIAATLFLWFMENNRILYAPDGHKRIADNALVALTLMIAESKTDEMDTMVKVVVNLINGDNK